MKTTIRKILREGDFKWAEDIPGLGVGFEYEDRNDYIVIVYTVVEEGVDLDGYQGNDLRVSSSVGGNFIINGEVILEKLSSGEYIRISPLKQFSHR